MTSSDSPMAWPMAAAASAFITLCAPMRRSRTLAARSGDVEIERHAIGREIHDGAGPHVAIVSKGHLPTGKRCGDASDPLVIEVDGDDRIG